MKKIKPLIISHREILRSIRKPLPKKTGGVHTPKTAYNRKKAKHELRETFKSHIWE